MCPNLTQPEEIELAVKEMESGGSMPDDQDKGSSCRDKNASNSVAGCYVSPYRAAYVKSRTGDGAQHFSGMTKS